MFEEGADRKMVEREMFSFRTVEEPDKAETYMVLSDYADIDERYYRMAMHYYRGEYEVLDLPENQDLLLLTRVSEIPPRLYAEYLRAIDPACREDEKVTHRAIVELKAAMREAAGLRR